mgnify:CR=1 FL=1
MDFNPHMQLAGLLEWMNEMMQSCHGKTAVIGISGGKDSSVFFDAAQKADVNQLLDMGIKLYVQQTPTYQSVDIDAKL